jgi:protein TonB
MKIKSILSTICHSVDRLSLIGSVLLHFIFFLLSWFLLENTLPNKWYFITFIEPTQLNQNPPENPSTHPNHIKPPTVKKPSDLNPDTTTTPPIDFKISNAPQPTLNTQPKQPETLNKQPSIKKEEESPSLSSQHTNISLSPLTQPAKPIPNNPKPIYPQPSKQLGEEGIVEVTVQVSVNGNVSDIKVSKSSGFKRLDSAVKKQVARWAFLPALKDGNKIEDEVKLSFTFTLADPD